MSKTLDLFKTATVVPSPKSRLEKAPAIELKGLEIVAAIDHVQKWLKMVIKNVKAPVHATIMAKMVAATIKLGQRPESFEAQEGMATSNNQLRKRASDQPLNPIEIALCEKHDVPLGQAGEALLFNPKHMQWVMDNSKALSKAFANIKGCPEDLILKTEPSTIVTDETLDYVFTKLAKKPKVLVEVLPVVASVAIIPKFDFGNEDDERNVAAFDIVHKVLSVGIR